jgi:cyanophycinase
VPTIKPIVLLADSQLLFFRDDEGAFLERVRAMLHDDEAEINLTPKAAYLGASNGDAPEFYDLFQAAMDSVNLKDRRMIPAEPSAEDMAYLGEADLILLAGGDTARGYRAFEASKVKDRLVERYYGGALLLGISAGAVQLGMKGWDGERLFDTLRLVPFVVDVHDEPSWSRLLQAVPKAGEYARGFGIPTGGGAIYHPDYSVEPVRHPLSEVSLDEEGKVRQALLFPGEVETVEAPPEGEGGPRAAAPSGADAEPGTESVN